MKWDLDFDDVNGLTGGDIRELYAQRSEAGWEPTFFDGRRIHYKRVKPDSLPRTGDLIEHNNAPRPHPLAMPQIQNVISETHKQAVQVSTGKRR
jgi:hypothetical protein